MKVRALAYIGLEATDVAAWQSYATDVLGLMKVHSEDTGTVKFRMDTRSWRIEVEQGRRNDIAYAGFEVANPDDLDAVRRRVEEYGIAVTRGDADLLTKRGVVDLFHFQDLIGLRVEVFYGATEVFEQPFCSPTGTSGFVTGEQGIGHVVLLVPDVQLARRFYEKTLGLQLTDIIDMPTPAGTVELLFMNCNARHHTLALARMASEQKLDHFLIEVASIDDMGLAYDRALKSGVPIRATIGRHTNDHMVSFYAYTPSGVAVEYGWGARTLNRDWNVVRYDSASVWGHHRPPRGERA